jgi:hypothetical protein
LSLITAQLAELAELVHGTYRLEPADEPVDEPPFDRIY